MVKRIDFNADIGESFGSYQLGLDTEIVKYISSANIATGFHAGDPNWMRKTVLLAEENGLGIGAHPSYPDLNGFGRREMTLSPYEIYNVVTYQIGALTAFVKGHKLRHVKPHGAMYNRAVDDEPLARSICDAVLEVDPNMVLVALAGSRWAAIAKEMGLRVAREIFADRALNSDGTLVSRSHAGSVLHDVAEVVDRSLRMVMEGKATTVEGGEIEVQAESLCVHGDTPGAVEMAKALRQGLESASVQVVPLGTLV